MTEISGFLINKDSSSIFLIDRLDLPFDPVLFPERIQAPITLDQHDLFQMPGLFIPESGHLLRLNLSQASISAFEVPIKPGAVADHHIRQRSDSI